MVRTIHERGGGHATADQLAAYLGYSGTRNGAFINRLGGARIFTLVEGPNGGLRPSPRAWGILQPDYPEAAERGRLEAFFSVPLYAAFFREYEGRQLPKADGMINALRTKFEIKSKHVDVILKRLLDSADQSGLFRVAGSRSRMVRPPLSSGLDLAAAGQVYRVQGTDEAPERRTSPTSPGDAGRYHKLIEGALEELPTPGSGWREEEMMEWLDLFDRVLHVVYKVQRSEGVRSQ